MARPRRRLKGKSKFYHAFVSPGHVATRTGRISKQLQFGTARAQTKDVARYLSTAIGILLGILIFGSLGVFFLYVPILPFAAAITILVGLILMFILGVQTGGRRIRILRRKNATPPQVAEEVR